MTSDNALIVALVLFVLYFLPAIVAIARKKLHPGGVLVVNLFLGWTFIGWIVALAMAAGGPTETAQVVAPAKTGGHHFTAAEEYVEMRDCPQCAERVKAAAKICRYCGHELT